MLTSDTLIVPVLLRRVNCRTAFAFNPAHFQGGGGRLEKSALMTRRIRVRVIPRSNRNSLVAVSDGDYTARVTAPPVEGAANEAVVELLVKELKVAKSRIVLVSGETSRNKTFEIDE